MGTVFENVWLLLTVAGVALVAVSIARQVKPEWGYWPLGVPLAIAGLAFALDAAVTTDTEAITKIIATSKQAAVRGDVDALMAIVSPAYTDTAHHDKADLRKTAERVLASASIKKIKTQSHLLTLQAQTAQSQLNLVVHFNNDSRYAAAGSLLFAGVKLSYEKRGENWYISAVEDVTINNQRWNW